jgi:2,4-dienoyl-CoA reductase-like NADH-dependent reductase (Old Yellow Enzyme family)
MNSLHVLCQPFTLKSLKLKNRFAMSPMTRYFAPDGMPTADMAAYYRRRAEGDVDYTRIGGRWQIQTLKLTRLRIETRAAPRAVP